MCKRQSRKVILDMINTLFLTIELSHLLLLLSFSNHKRKSVVSRAILANFFEEQWTQNHPQYLSGLSRALFPTTFCYVLGQTDNCTQDGGSTKNCINPRAHGFYSNRIHTAGSVWITDTITNVMIHYNTSPQKCCAWQEIKVQDNCWNSLNDQKFKKRNKTIRSTVQCH